MDAKVATDERDSSGRRSRVVLTPRCWRQVREKQNFSGATVARKAVHRGELEVSRKPLRREGRDASAEPVCSCAFLCACLHTRPRVQRAPGFPCALLFLSRAAIDAKLGRIAPRECGRTSSRCMTIKSENSPQRRPGQVSASERRSGTHTALCLRYNAMDDAIFAKLTPVAMGPCFRRDDAERSRCQSEAQRIRRALARC